MTFWARAFGLFGSLRSALATGLDVLHTRICLFGTELEQELLRAGSLVLQAITALLLAFFAIGFIGLALIIIFWDSHRQLVALLVAAFFLVLAVATALRLKRALADRPRPFNATLEALEQDRDALRNSW